jgi:DNA polymerase sigma
MAGTISSVADGASEMRTRQAKKGNKMRTHEVATASENAVAKAGIATDDEPSRLGLSLSGLKRDILARLEELMPTSVSSDIKERCLQELQSMARQLGPEWDALPFGSYANGFGTAMSDLDVVFNESVAGTAAQCKAVAVLGEKIIPMLQQHKSFAVVEQVLGARIPIVKLRFEGRLDVDISCYNPQPVLNTRLLNAYSRIDTRIQQLGIVVKSWAKSAGVCDASKSNLSSYSFTLLVLYFLQVHEHVKLPVLPEEIATRDIGVDEAISSAAARWKCPLSLTDLFVLFLEFYSGDFKWGTEVVSLRFGERRMMYDDAAFHRLRGRQFQRIHIEDPIQHERNLNCVLGETEEGQLRGAFFNSLSVVVTQVTPAELKPKSLEVELEATLKDLRFSQGEETPWGGGSSNRSDVSSSTTADVNGTRTSVSSEDEGNMEHDLTSPNGSGGDISLLATLGCSNNNHHQSLKHHFPAEPEGASSSALSTLSAGVIDCATLEKQLSLKASAA